MSRVEGIRSRHKLEQSSGGQSLPEQWGSVQRRLEYLESSIIKMHKKNVKYEKRLTCSEDELTLFRREFNKKISEVQLSQNNQMVSRERELQLQNMRQEMGQLHSFIKRVQKKSTQMVKQLRYISNGVGKESEHRGDDQIQLKLQRHFLKNKNYIDRAVNELQANIKQFSSQQINQEHRYSFNDFQKSSSKIKILDSNQKSTRNLKTSQLKYQQLNQKHNHSYDGRDKSPRSVSNNGNSRVSYLRERLKQFQEINKKYQDRSERKGGGVQERKSVQKMKQFRNYLEQSESEIEASNLQVREGDVLTDSMRRWRSGPKFAYE